jgi:hypothetical protein
LEKKLVLGEIFLPYLLWQNIPFIGVIKKPNSSIRKKVIFWEFNTKSKLLSKKEIA